MKNLTNLPFHAVVMAFYLATLNIALADSVEMNLPEGNYARKIGNGSLPDPSGKAHTKNLVAGKVAVVIFSVPDMAQGGTQQKWADLLSNDPKTKVSDRVFLGLVEDMSQAGMFKGQALNSMKKQFTPDSRPFLVLDTTGKVTKDFGVPRNKTEILIYDKKSNLRDVEQDLSDINKTDQRVKAITAILLKE